jgi:phosphoglycolate phosphatase
MMPPRPVKAVLFDLDGTLIDSAPDLGAAADKMRLDRGLPSLPLAHYRPLAGSGARGMLQLAFGITPEDAQYNDLRDEFFANYEAALTGLTRAFDGVPELIQTLLSHRVAWGVVTNKMERFTHPIVGGMDLFKTAGAVVSGDTTPHPKPHPAPLLEAAKRMGLEPQYCVYVGDDERDILAGRAAGMWTVAAHYGYLGQGVPASDWGAHAHIHTPLALLKILELD